MGSTKHEKSFVDFEYPYEQNIIGFKGIIYFGIGLFLLIAITFFLMWALMNALHDNAGEPATNNPMMMTEMERLPPGHRLQSAPGFGVDSDRGRVNLELSAPQSEYWELKRQWEDLLQNGRKDAATGVMTTLPIDMAKERFLEQNAKARSGPEADQVLEDALTDISDSSSGRIASEKRR